MKVSMRSCCEIISFSTVAFCRPAADAAEPDEIMSDPAKEFLAGAEPAPHGVRERVDR